MCVYIYTHVQGVCVPILGLYNCTYINMWNFLQHPRRSSLKIKHFKRLETQLFLLSKKKKKRNTTFSQLLIWLIAITIAFFFLWVHHIYISINQNRHANNCEEIFSWKNILFLNLLPLITTSFLKSTMKTFVVVVVRVCARCFTMLFAMGKMLIVSFIPNPTLGYSGNYLGTVRSFIYNKYGYLVEAKTINRIQKYWKSSPNMLFWRIWY